MPRAHGLLQLQLVVDTVLFIFIHLKYSLTICTVANIRDTSADQNKFISLIFWHCFIQFEENCSLTFRCCDKSAEISGRFASDDI